MEWQRKRRVSQSPFGMALVLFSNNYKCIFIVTDWSTLLRVFATTC